MYSCAQNSLRFPPAQRSKRGSHGTVFVPWVFLFVCLLLLLFLANCQSQPRLRIVAQEVTPAIEAAADDLAARIQQAGYVTEVATGPEASAAQVNAVILTVNEAAPDLQPEGFRIIPIRAGGFYLFQVIGKDPRGVLWGSQELAEQIISSGRLDTVFTQSANRRLPLRAIGLPLHLPEASAPIAAAPDPRALWREQVGLLSRSRFNAVFLRTTEPLTRFVPVPGSPGAPGTVTDEMRAQGDWLRDLVAIARDQGLDCYLWITPASFPSSSGPAPFGPASSDARPNAAPEAESANPAAEGSSLAPQFPLASRFSLAQILPAIFDFYPELGGVVLDPDLIPSGDPAERDRWLAENVLSPLADSDDHRPVFLGVGRGAGPSRDELSALAPDGRLRLLAPLPPSTEPLPESGYPVLWSLDLPPSDLRPWEDPSVAGAALRRIGARDSLGFLDVSWVSPSPSDAASPDQTLSLADSWFHLLLLGRMGYSPDLPEQYWVQQFARRFGPRAGLQVYAAASHGSRILDSLRRQAASVSFPPPEALSAPGTTDPALVFRLLRSFLMEQEDGFSAGEVLAEVLREQDWLLPGQPLPRGAEAAAVSLETKARETKAPETDAREALAQAADAGRFGAWRDPANQPLLHRIQTMADAGIALGERHRAALALARFLLGGKEADRQQAIGLLQSAQQRFAAEPSQRPPLIARPRVLGPLAAHTAAVLDAIPGLAPWQWRKTAWEVGTVHGGTLDGETLDGETLDGDTADGETLDALLPAFPAETPAPFQWTNAETASLREFGLFGLQLWMASLNQQLRRGFLMPVAGSLAPDGSASSFVARTRISIPSSGQLVLRLLSTQPGTIWVNGRPAAPVSPAQFSWPVGSPPPPPLLVQMFAQTVPPGNAEVIVSVPASATEAPAFALQSTFAAQARVPLPISAAEASLAGGVVLVPPAAGALQPHLAFVSPREGAAAAGASEASASQADFPFVLRDPGFYRIRLWSFWETPPCSGLALSLDGSSLSRSVGKDDPATGLWHWVPVDTVAALGPGEHRLRITGWTAASRVGIVEISQQDALLPGS